MSTQVVLLQRVENLGEIGDVVRVRPGYARNFLLPQRKALRANKENMVFFEARKNSILAENDKKRADASLQADKIKDVKVPLIRQASEAGQLFGSVAARDIAQELSNVSGVAVTRNMIQLNQNFKLIGLFPVDVALHPEVKVQVIVNIARSVEEAEIQARTGKALIAEAQGPKAVKSSNAPVAEKTEAEIKAEAEAALAAVLEDGALESSLSKVPEESE
jgi:large subunit ribosomal protein L9